MGCWFPQVHTTNTKNGFNSGQARRLSSVLFCSFSFCSVLFCSVLFCSVLFPSETFVAVVVARVLWQWLSLGGVVTGEHVTAFLKNDVCS